VTTSRPDIKIVDFREELAADFARLNYEWIEKAYAVEDHDRELLDNPYEQIIVPGGQILFAFEGETVLGTVALIPMEGNSFELAKMAVAPRSRGLGIGEKLMAACIECSQRAVKRRIILESNTKQVAAVALYRKFGFQETPLDPNSHFSRANIRMELILDQ
jgi:ribosomal protein S18 acetylase RimI-like enzyme